MEFSVIVLLRETRRGKRIEIGISGAKLIG
jgi:hypothetical protein